MPRTGNGHTLAWFRAELVEKRFGVWKSVENVGR